MLWWVGLTTFALFTPLINLMTALAGASGPSEDWAALMTVGGVSVLCAVGIGGVIAIAWPMARRQRDLADLDPITADSPGGRAHFWYLAALGWMLIGSVGVAIVALSLLNWFGSDWLPEWWKRESWPGIQWIAAIISVMGASLIGVDVLRATRRDRQVPGKNSGPRRVRLGMLRWTFGLRHMMFALAPIALLMVLARDFGMSLVAVFGLMLPPLAIVSIFLALTDRRSLQREALLQVMAMSARDRQPLGPALAAFAPTCRGQYARLVAEVAARLERGDPLPQALDLVPNVLSRSGEIVARVGWETGTLGRMLDDAVAAASAEKATRAASIGSFAYPLAILATVLGVAVFLTAFAGPRVEEVMLRIQGDPSRTFKVGDGRDEGLVCRRQFTKPDTRRGHRRGHRRWRVRRRCSAASSSSGLRWTRCPCSID